MNRHAKSVACSCACGHHHAEGYDSRTAGGRITLLRHFLFCCEVTFLIPFPQQVERGSREEGKESIRYLSDTLLALILGPSQHLIHDLDLPSQELVRKHLVFSLFVWVFLSFISKVQQLLQRTLLSRISG
jgi:hypothetical protein